MSDASTDHGTEAVAYLRVSGKSQIDGDGFPRQRETVERYAAQHGLTIVDEYLDEAVSGSKEIADRDGLASLIDRIENNGVRIVLVETSQRIARDLMVGEVILAEFRRLGCKVIECSGGNDLTVGDDNPTGKLIRQLLGAVAEYDKTMLVLKLRAARERKRRLTGRGCGPIQFGYDAKRPHEVRTALSMLSLREKGYSWRKVAERLNCLGHRTRRGRLWDQEYCRTLFNSIRKLENAGLVLPAVGGSFNSRNYRERIENRSEDERPGGIA